MEKSTCSVITFHKHIQVFLLVENSMTGRAQLHGGSVEPSLAEIHQEMSELLDKQVNAQTEKSFPGSHKLLQAHEKVFDENKTKKKKQRGRKNLIHGRKPFIMPKQKTGENDLHKLLGNNCEYNELRYYLCSKWVNWC